MGLEVGSLCIPSIMNLFIFDAWESRDQNVATNFDVSRDVFIACFEVGAKSVPGFDF